jgi:membrane-associated phospholipid phosphatase
MFRCFCILLTLMCSLPALAKTPTLLEHAAGDIESSFADYPMLILVSGVIATSLTLPLDDNVENYLSNHRISKKMDDTAHWIGHPYILGPASVIVYGTSLLGHNEHFQLISETMVEALIFNSVMTEGLKYGLNRQRPNGGHYSFPSGHTSTAFTIASVLQSFEGWKIGVPAFAVASFIGFTRLDGNYHHISDVVFGAALGSCIGLGSSLFHRNENTRLLISPILDQTRGIMLSYKFQ